MVTKGHRTGASIPGPAALVIPGVLLVSMVAIYGLMVFEFVEFNLAYLAAYLMGLAVYVVTLLNIQAGLAILVITMGLSPEYTIGEVSNLRLEDFLLPVILLGWFTQVITRREEPVPNELRAAMVIYFLLAMVSTLKNIIYSDLEFLSAFLHFFKIMSYFLIFLIVMNNVRNERQLNALIVAMLVASGLVGLYGIAQLTGLVSHGEGELVRLAGPPGESGNILGGYLTFHILLAIGVLAAAENKIYKGLLVALVLVILIPLAFTLSRTSFIAVFVGLLAVGLMRNRKIIIWMAIGVPILALLLPTTIISRIETIFQILSHEPPSSWTARLQMWVWASERIVSNPLIGSGIASYPLGGMDNEFVKQANDLGLIGLAVYVVILFKIGRTTFQEVRASDAFTPLQRGFVFGFFGAFAATMVHCVGATTLSAIRTGEAFFFAAGLLFALRHVRLNREQAVQLLRTRILDPVPRGAPGLANQPS